MSVIVKVFHVAVFLFYTKAVYQLTAITNRSQDEPPLVQLLKKNMFRFLTNWTFIVQLVYFLTCILAHVLDIVSSLHKLRDKVNSFGNIIFTTIVLPVGLCVTLMFWGIYFIDKNGIFPDWVEEYLPLWLNHSLHTLNFVLPFIDMCIVNHKFPSWFRAVTIIAIYLFAYGVCIVGSYIETGTWLYPFIEPLTWPQRGILALSTFFMAVLNYGAVKGISGLIWGPGKSAGKRVKSASPKKTNKPKHKIKKSE